MRAEPHRRGLGCPLRAAAPDQAEEILFTSFAHLDYARSPCGGPLCVCPCWGSVFNAPGEDRRRRMKALLGSRTCAREERSDQTFLGRESPQPQRRSSLQTEPHGRLRPGEGLSTLDIGCFDGALLRELRSRWGEPPATDGLA